MSIFHGYVKLPEGKLPNDDPMSILLENMVISWSEPSIWDHLYPMRNSGSENRPQQKTGYPTELFNMMFFFPDVKHFSKLPVCLLCFPVPNGGTLRCHIGLPQGHPLFICFFPPKPMNLRPPSDVSWSRFAPVTSSLNYSYKYHKP